MKKIYKIDAFEFEFDPEKNDWVEAIGINKEKVEEIRVKINKIIREGETFYDWLKVLLESNSGELLVWFATAGLKHIHKEHVKERIQKGKLLVNDMIKYLKENCKDNMTEEDKENFAEIYKMYEELFGEKIRD